MKTLFIQLCIFIILLFTITVLTFSQATWERVASPVNTNLTSISFADQFNGYITTENKILKTFNGGHNWIVLETSFSYSLGKIQFVNQNTGFVGNADGVFMELYRTSNSGVNWLQNAPGNRFCFVDSDHGWVRGGGSSQYTVNGGASWNYFYLPSNSTNISFGSLNFGITTGYFWNFMTGWMYMYIYKSTDGVSFNCVPGGVFGDPCAWSKTYDPVSFGEQPLFREVYLVDGTAGFLYGGYIPSNIYRTVDAGNTWGQISTGTAVANFDFVDHNTGYGAGTGTIIYTTNCGSTWTNQNVGVATQIRDVYMLNNSTGWACGDNGVILKSGTSLPVKLTYFNSIPDKNNVTLQWGTAQEINNKGFDIMRFSENEGWKTVGFVNGFGTFDESKNYVFTDRKLATGTYRYKLKQIDYNGNFEFFTLDNDVVIGTPKVFMVSQNYPNPSNPKSRIDYEIPVSGKVTIKLYNLLGEEIMNLVNEIIEAGYYTAEIDGSDLASGVYYYIISTVSFTQTKKMVLVK